MKRIVLLFVVLVSAFLIQCGGSFHPAAQTQGPQGPPGPAGPTGPQGPQGPAGPAGPNTAAVVAFSGVPDFTFVNSGLYNPSCLIDVGGGTLPCSEQSSIWTASENGVSGAQWYAGGVGGLPGAGGLPIQAYAGPTGPGSFTANSNSSFSLASGTISLETLLQVAGSGVVGLANGADQSNSIEFVVSGSNLKCQTVSAGTATVMSVTSTLVAKSYYQFQIVANPNAAHFYVNGTLVATITTNIPSTSLHALFSTSSDGTALSVLTMGHTEFKQFVPL